MKNKKEKIPCVHGNARVQSHSNAVLQLPEIPGMIVLSKYNSSQEQKKPSFLKGMFAKKGD